MRIIEKVVQSNIEPTRQGVVWVDTSDPSAPIVKIYLNGRWEVVSQSGGKGSVTVKSLTKEEYDALEEKDSKTLYIVKNDPANGHEWVDIGTVDDKGYHIVWATKNIGAENPWDAGKYFAWGDTVGYYADEGHDFSNENTPYWDADNEEYTKYNETDELTELQPEDDAAHVQWGGKWQTCIIYDEDNIFNSLEHEIIHSEIQYIVYKNEQNICCFPLSGYIELSETYNVGDMAFYWTTKHDKIGPDTSKSFHIFDDATTEGESMERYIGQPIRPIIKVKNLSELDPTYDIYLGENKVVDNSSKISDYDKSILDPGEEQYAYGVLIDFTQGKSSYDLTRIGNMDLHRTLPVQSQYKGCIWDPGHKKIVTYLNPEDWSLATEDKTAEEIDELLHDAEKSIRVETPKFYACSKVLATDGAGNTTMAKVMFSTQKLNPWYIEVPKMVTDFRDVRLHDDGGPTSTLNTTDNLYGGYCTTKNNIASAKPDLLHPITNIDRLTMRDSAINYNTHIFSYDAYKWIFYWAVVIEYATLFTAKPMIQELDENGFHQGGLGPGMTSIESYGLKDADGNYIYNGTYDVQDNFYLGADYFQSDSTDKFPLRDIGCTNNLGNHTGENTVEYTANGKTSLVHQNRYRGFEFPFGDIWMNIDGVLCANRNGIDYYLTCKNPEHFVDDVAESLWYNSETSEDWRIAGTIKKEFNSKNSYYQYPISFGGYDEAGQMMYANIGNEGDLIPQATIQPSDGQPRNFVNQFYPIDADNNIDSPNTLRVGCVAHDVSVHGVGLCHFDALAGVGAASYTLGFRCFNIIEE